MGIHIHVHQHYDSEKLILKLLNQIIMNQAELKQKLENVLAQNEKARVEILQKNADLEAAIIAAGQTTSEVNAALEALKASVRVDDDIVPDPV